MSHELKWYECIAVFLIGCVIFGGFFGWLGYTVIFGG